MRVKINGQLGSANSLYNSFLLFLRLLLTILASAAAVSAQQKTLSQEKRLEIEKAVSTFMSANSVPGMGAALVLDGEPVWSAGFGMADLEDSAPATSSTEKATSPRIAPGILQAWKSPCRFSRLTLWSPIREQNSTTQLTAIRFSGVSLKALRPRNTWTSCARIFSSPQAWCKLKPMI